MVPDPVTGAAGAAGKVAEGATAATAGKAAGAAKGVGAGLGGLFSGIGAKATATSAAIFGGVGGFFSKVGGRIADAAPAPKFVVMFLLAVIITIANYLFSVNIALRLALYILFFISAYFILKQNLDSGAMTVGIIYTLVGLFAPTIGNFITSWNLKIVFVEYLLLFVLFLFGYLGPILWLMTLTKHEENWLTITLEIILVIFMFIFAVTFFVNQDVIGDGDAISAAQRNVFGEMFRDMWETIKNTPGFLGGIVNDTKANINKSVADIKGESYEEQVDAKSGVELGLTISPVEFSNAGAVYYQGDPISAWSVLEASSLDRTITINTACYVDRRQGVTEKKEGEITPGSFEVTDLGYKDLVCKFPRDTFTKVDTHEMEILANFSFTTSSYLRRYFIDEENYLNLKRSDIEPEDYYEIPMSDENGVFTVGPVDLAIKKPNLLHPLGDSESNFIVGIEVGVNRKLVANEGKITRIKKLVLALPDGFTLARVGGRYDCGQYEFVDYSTNDCIADCRNDARCAEDCATFSQYRLEVENNRSGLSIGDDKYNAKIVKTPFTVPCFVEPISKNAVLDQSALSIKNFRAYVDYDFQVSSAKSFQIEALDGYSNKNSKKELPGCTGLETGYLDAEYSATETGVETIKTDAATILNNVSSKIGTSVLNCDPLMKALIAYQNVDGASNRKGYGYTEITQAQLEDVGLWEKAEPLLADVENSHSDILLTSEYIQKKMEECGDLDCAIGWFVCGQGSGTCVESRLPLIIELAERFS